MPVGRGDNDDSGRRVEEPDKDARGLGRWSWPRAAAGRPQAGATPLRSALSPAAAAPTAHSCSRPPIGCAVAGHLHGVARGGAGVHRTPSGVGAGAGRSRVRVGVGRRSPGQRRLPDRSEDRQGDRQDRPRPELLHAADAGGQPHVARLLRRVDHRARGQPRHQPGRGEHPERPRLRRRRRGSCGPRRSTAPRSSAATSRPTRSRRRSPSPGRTASSVGDTSGTSTKDLDGTYYDVSHQGGRAHRAGRGDAAHPGPE